MKKFMLRIMPIVLTFVLIVGNVWAANNDIFNPSGSIDSVDGIVSNVWGTVLTILRILAVAAIVYAGVKYMFASAEDKADIKSGLLGLVVGAILVFGASIVVDIIMNAVNDAT